MSRPHKEFQHQSSSIKELYKGMTDCRLCSSFDLEILQVKFASRFSLPSYSNYCTLVKMAELTGKFQLTVGDEDNFDKIMAAAGNV